MNAAYNPRLLLALIPAALAGCGEGGAGRVDPPPPPELSGRIAYLVETVLPSPDTTRVVLHTFAGGEEREVVRRSDVWIEGQAWSWDGGTVVLQLGQPSRPDRPPERWLARYTADGAGGERIYDGEGAEVAPAFSRDGRLAYRAGVQETEAELRVDGAPVASVGFFASLAWLPEGEAVVVDAMPGLTRVGVPGGETQLLVPMPSDDSWLSAPAVSGSGRIAFLRRVELPGLWVAEAGGQNPRRITESDGDEWPAWSPDGRYIAFVRRGHEIRVVDADEGGDRVLVRIPDQWISSLVWIP